MNNKIMHIKLVDLIGREGMCDNVDKATGNCNCEENAPLSDAEIEEEELECIGCGNTYSIVSGDCVSHPELDGIKIYDISEEDGNIYLNL